MYLLSLVIPACQRNSFFHQSTIQVQFAPCQLYVKWILHQYFKFLLFAKFQCFGCIGELQFWSSYFHHLIRCAHLLGFLCSACNKQSDSCVFIQMLHVSISFHREVDCFFFDKNFMVRIIMIVLHLFK